MQLVIRLLMPYNWIFPEILLSRSSGEGAVYWTRLDWLPAWFGRKMLRSYKVALALAQKKQQTPTKAVLPNDRFQSALESVNTLQQLVDTYNKSPLMPVMLLSIGRRLLHSKF